MSLPNYGFSGALAVLTASHFITQWLHFLNVYMYNVLKISAAIAFSFCSAHFLSGGTVVALWCVLCICSWYRGKLAEYILITVISHLNMTAHENNPLKNL